MLDRVLNTPLRFDGFFCLIWHDYHGNLMILHFLLMSSFITLGKFTPVTVSSYTQQIYVSYCICIHPAKVCRLLYLDTPSKFISVIVSCYTQQMYVNYCILIQPASVCWLLHLDTPSKCMSVTVSGYTQQMYVSYCIMIHPASICRLLYLETPIKCMVVTLSWYTQQIHIGYCVWIHPANLCQLLYRDTPSKCMSVTVPWYAQQMYVGYCIMIHWDSVFKNYTLFLSPQGIIFYCQVQKLHLWASFSVFFQPSNASYMKEKNWIFFTCFYPNFLKCQNIH